MQRFKKIACFKLNDIWFDTELFKKSNDRLVCLHSNTVLDEADYDFKLDGKTFVLDISKSEEELLRGFEQKSCRYAINRSIRDELRVWHEQSETGIRQYFEFQNNFCKEKGIPQIEWEDMENLDIFCASTKDGEFLGGCAFLLSQADSTVRYKYGSTLHKLNANEAILWHSIKEYRIQGYKFFDFGGCVPTDDKESYYYRHYRFKEKWGGDLVDSYNYFKVSGILKLMYRVFAWLVDWKYKGDFNSAIVHLGKMGFIR